MTKSKKTKQNKVLLSIGLIATSVIYVFSQYGGGAPTSVASAAPSRQSATSNTSSPKIAQSAPPPQAKSATGLYANGTYTGTAVDAYYGTLQVQAVVRGGKLADVQFLQYASDRSASRSINLHAMPILKSEAIAAQGSSVNIVSGATFTSQAFQQSLHAALTQAQA